MSPAQLEFAPVAATVYAVSIYVFMFIVASYFIRQDTFAKSLTVPSGRYGSLDGLRGVLATGVFIHHAFAMYVYFSGGEWQWSTSPVFNQLGQTTVSLFFMITGFLFTLKALAPTIDWKRLYASRVLRLVPLYALIVSSIFGLVFFLSHWKLNEPVWEIIKEYWVWMTFVCFGRPDINAYPMSWTLIANVNWSLKYEIMFYLFAVPAIHVFSRFVQLRAALVLCAAMLGAILLFRWQRGGEGGISLYTVQFLGGVMVAYAFKIDRLKAVIEGNIIRWLAAGALVSLFFMQYAYSAVAVIGNIIMFAAVVGGASIFGLLKHKSAVWLGDISYGIYLMHGLVLWLVLNMLAKAGILSQLGLVGYWLVTFATAASIVLLASCSYALLEKPVMGLLPARKQDRVRGYKQPGLQTW